MGKHGRGFTKCKALHWLQLTAVQEAPPQITDVSAEAQWQGPLSKATLMQVAESIPLMFVPSHMPFTLQGRAARFLSYSGQLWEEQITIPGGSVYQAQAASLGPSSWPCCGRG